MSCPPGSGTSSADQERDRLHRRDRLADEVELASTVGAPDARPQIGVAGQRIDPYLSLRRVEGRAQDDRTDDVGIEGLGPFG